MAEQKKKTTAAGGSSGSKSSNKRPSSGGSKTSKAAQAKTAAARAKMNEARARRRRTVGALVLAFVGLLTLLGYFTSDGVVVKLLRGLLTGLFGGGFYLLPPMLLTAAVLLVMNRDGKAGGRIAAALAVPVLTAAFCQVFAKTYDLDMKMFRCLWQDGQALAGGGAVGGCVALLFTKLFSKAGAVILLLFLSAFALLALSGMTLRGLVDLARQGKREREERELEAYMNAPEAEPEAAPRPAEARRRAEQARQSINVPAPSESAAGAQEASRPAVNIQEASAPRRRAPFDIPMDDEPEGMPEHAGDQPQAEAPKKSGFFNKTKGAPAPDSLFAGTSESGSASSQEAPAQPEKPVKPAPVPIETVKRPAEAEARVATAKPAPIPVPLTPPAQVLSKGEAAAAAGEIASLVEEGTKREGERAYQFPPITLLNEPVRTGSRDSQDELSATKDRLELCLRSFGVNVTVSNIVHGPSITRYEMELEIGVKLNKLTNLADDIALALGVTGVRIAAIPNKISTVGIEVPNKNVSTVYLREIIDAPEFRNAKSKLTFAIGKNISGDVMVGNISKLPHLLVAGTTGSGKSVCLNSLILSLMYKATPEEVKFIMIDPKMVEFKIYNGIPHLLIPVVTEAKKAAGALQWAVVEMMKRYRLFSDAGARDLAGYNAQLDPETPKIPQIVVIIDELADLMMIAAKEVEESICRVAQMGRAAGVHLVIATQSPRADVITGLMKANIPSRIALKVASSLESRIILDAGGAADKLVGNGDMLYAPIGASKPTRIQGTWVSDEEREAVIEYVKCASGEVSYSEDVIYEIEKAAAEKEAGGKGGPAQSQEDKFKDYDELLPQAAEIIFETKIASVSALQRRLKLGYARAARIVDQLEEVGVLGPFEGSKPRQIIMTYQQWQEMQFVQGTAPIGQTGTPDYPAMPEAGEDGEAAGDFSDDGE